MKPGRPKRVNRQTVKTGRSETVAKLRQADSDSMQIIDNSKAQFFDEEIERQNIGREARKTFNTETQPQSRTFYWRADISLKIASF